MAYQYDTIILGAGSGGISAFVALSSIGRKVLLVERDKMGGECTNTGCIPSKSLIHQAKRFREAQGLVNHSAELDMLRKKSFDTVREKIKQIRDEEEPELLMQKYKNEVIRGSGSFIDQNSIEVRGKDGTKMVTAQAIIIATGSSARTVPIAGLKTDRLLTNENIFELKEIPKNLLILGGGPIGCELGQALHHLGTKVTIVNNREHIMPRDEEECSKLSEEVFTEQGIRIFNNATIHRIEKDHAVIEITENSKLKTRKVPFEYLLQGVGRVPNIDGLNLEAVGIKHNDRQIYVDRHYRTNLKHVYAIGDVSSSAKFTHTAEDQARHIMKRMIFPWYPAETKKPIPHVTYLDQEVAGVGDTYAEAVKKYGKNRVVKVTADFSSSDRSKTDEVQTGILVANCAPLTGKIYGAHIMGQSSGEMIGIFTLAIQEGISMFKLNKMIIPYPTLSQSIKFLTDAYLSESSANGKKYLTIFIGKWLMRVLILITASLTIWYLLK